MRLEDSIQQPDFRNDYHKALVNILFTSNWVSNQIKQLLKPYEVSMPQYNVLRILRGSDPKPLSVAQIRERMLDPMSDVSRMIVRLEKQDLVQRTVCAEDRRLVDILISEKAKTLLTALDQDMNRLDERLRALDEREVQQLNKLLDKFRYETTT